MEQANGADKIFSLLKYICWQFFQNLSLLHVVQINVMQVTQERVGSGVTVNDPMNVRHRSESNRIYKYECTSCRDRNFAYQIY